jgi:hypothetical protein
MRWLTASAALVALLSGVVVPAESSSPLFRFADPRIVESSGLATSSYGDGIVYTHNDSGDQARFFAVGATGATVAVYTLRGAVNTDWEDMASGTDADGRPLLYLADIGDNSRSRASVDVYQVPEPRGPSADVPWVRYRFRYPDGPHDAETLLVDPRAKRLYIASKTLIGDGELYAAPTTLSTTGVNVLTPVRSVPPLTTSGDFSPDGERVVFLTYLRAYWATGVAATLHAFDVPRQSQDEAIAFNRDGTSVLVGSEGVGSAVYRVALPELALASESSSSGSSSFASASASASASSSQAASAAATPVSPAAPAGPGSAVVPLPVIALSAGAGGVALLVMLLRRRRRSRRVRR